MASRAKKPVKSVAKPKTGAAKGRETLASLRQHVDEIEARLSRADKNTKSSVRALKASFKKLNEKSAASGSNDQDLTPHLDALSAQLTTLIDKTRDDVAHDLQVILDDPRLETISVALTKANHRITVAEKEQARSISAINEQISTLAAIVDDRLQTETRERQELEQKLSTKIDAIEQRSASAVRALGDKVVGLTEELTQRADTQGQNIEDTVAAKALQHRHELDEHKSEISRRIEALEDDQRNTIPSIERRLVTLTSRLEILETEGFNVAATQAAPPAYAPLPQVEAEAPYVTTPANIDAFTPQPVSAYETVAQPPELTAQPAPQAVVPSPEPAPPLASAEPHIPQEYVPQEYMPPAAPQTDVQQTPFNPAEYRAPAPVHDQLAEQPMVQPAMADPYANPALQGEPAAYTPDTGTPPPPFEADAPPMLPLPEQTMDAARPGGEATAPGKKGLFSLIKGGVTGSRSPVRILALMTGVAVLGLFAAQRVMGSGGNADTRVQQQATQAQSTNPTQVAGVYAPESETEPVENEEPTPPVIESMDAVGDYSDAMQPPDLEPQANGKPSPQLQTLESAAAKGDMIAQFQMGLSHLEAGRNAEAVRLIRLSANQGQPAAQYRLAKLYENGVGVEKDPQTAMKLLERSAKGGNRIAMHDLGHYYATAAATDEPDITRAVDWFRKAAERGVLDSQFNLGVLYQDGAGVTKSPVDAYVWYAIAGAQGDQMAVQRSEAIARELSESQLEQARTKVKAFTPARIDDAANGVFRQVPWAGTARNAAGGNLDVKTAQERLADLGYAVGTPDGAMGPRTRNAIIRFERANGLPETGRVSAELIDRLNLAAGV